ncbi:hypothetical protein IFM89_035742 [Coptis chinensis]|uniref:ENTH domain-containing protein n=1 Tax=Coptis chinensis TaxID=261450 RepID=A0A835H4I9_9MAGN|nr:hypothetical protein IFM89_035742 [Coptis chinensis]
MTHDDDPTDEKYIREILTLTSYSRIDEAHSNSWDHSAFVRTYALYLDQKLECLVYEKKRQGSGGGDRYGGRRDEPYRSGSGSGHDDRFGGRRVEPYRSPPGGYGGGFRDDFGGYGTRPPPRSGSYGDVIEAGRGGGGGDDEMMMRGRKGR